MSIEPALNVSLNQTLFSSELVEIGLFDCPRSHPLFHDSGPISHYLVVFPRHAVRIRHEGHREVVANSRVITLYNHAQEYRREGISPYGDQSFWLRFRKPETYLLQRQLSRSLMISSDNDFLPIAEASMKLLRRAVDGTREQEVKRRQFAASPGARARHRRLVRRCEELLSTRAGQALTLESIAAELATTPFHLSRVFSCQTGQSIHQYLLQLRLRMAMDRIIDHPRERLTDIGLDAGFATPSHFSQAFRKNFGVTPRQFRA